MKVVFVTPDWPPEHCANGIVSYVGGIRDGLDELGVESRVLAGRVLGGGRHPEAVSLEEVYKQRRAEPFLERLAHRFHPLDMDAYLFSREVICGMRHLKKTFRPDILETEESFGACERIAKRLRLPVVVRLHGPWFLNGAALAVRRDEAFLRRVAVEGRAIANAEAVTSPSQDLLDQVRNEYGIELADAEVIPNPAPVVEPERRWTLDGCDPNLVLFIGRFDRHKGGDLVIDAFARVAARRPELRLLFVGPDRGFDDGGGTSIGLQEYIESQVPDLSIRSRIETAGQLAYPEIERLRAKARVTIVASRFEVFGMVVVEALAFGCPVVAARAGGIPEIVSHEENGLLFAPGDSGALARSLEVALDDDARAAQMGARGARDMELSFSPRAVAERTKAFYAKTLARGSH